jgi:hypothetical protein
VIGFSGEFSIAYVRLEPDSAISFESGHLHAIVLGDLGSRVDQYWAPLSFDENCWFRFFSTLERIDPVFSFQNYFRFILINQGILFCLNFDQAHSQIRRFS